MQDAVEELADRGLNIPAPHHVYVGPEVSCAQIADDVTLHPGCRITGSTTSIGPGCVLGAEGPVTVDGCQLGSGVALKGGFFSGSVFLDGVNVGSGAHVRAGTLLEEEANAAHAVGFKQTIFLPFVTAGSLINLCDCLMAGGTDRKHHSEVGSSYIHFNFTPQGDKATASLIGDVPHGVMLNQSPIFLGGQGGLVGPVQIAFGTVIAAGCVHRQDVLDPDRLIMSAPNRPIDQPYDLATYSRMATRIVKNLRYLGNLMALKAWYLHVRKSFMTRDPFSLACFNGAVDALELVIDERIQRLGQLAGKAEVSIVRLREIDGSAEEISAQQAFAHGWCGMEIQLQQLHKQLVSSVPPLVLSQALAEVPSTYIQTIRQLGEDARCAGTAWLQDIVQASVDCWSHH